MARSESNILAKDTGRVQSAALVVLCALAGLQLALLGWSAWQSVAGPFSDGEAGGSKPTTRSIAGQGVSAAPLAAPPLPGQLAGVAGSFSGTNPGLTPPMPGMLAGEAAPSTQGVPATAPGALMSPGPGLPVPDPEVAELLETVSQLRSAGETEGLLELLKAAEGMDQNHPSVLKEFALTYEQMGLTDKARDYWRRIVEAGEAAGGVFYSMAKQRLERLGAVTAPPPLIPPNTAGALTPPNMVGGMPAVPTVPGRVVREAGAKLGVGNCQVVKDLAVVDGDRRTLRIPIMKVGDDQIEPTAVNVDVFFYDLVNGSKVEPTRADPPVASWVASPVDWAGAGTEPLDVTYFLPPMTPQEEKNHGRREFHGYLVKLYYQDRLQAVVAEPRELLEESPAPPMTAPTNPFPGR